MAKEIKTVLIDEDYLKETQKRAWGDLRETYKTSEQFDGGLASVCMADEIGYKVGYLDLDVSKYHTFVIGAEDVMEQFAEIQCGAALTLDFSKIEDKEKPIKFNIIQNCPFIRFTIHSPNYKVMMPVGSLPNGSFSTSEGIIGATGYTTGGWQTLLGSVCIQGDSAAARTRLFGTTYKLSSTGIVSNADYGVLPDIDKGITCATMLYEMTAVWSPTFSVWLCTLDFKGSVSPADVV